MFLIHICHIFRNLTANPHIAGTPQDFTQADMLRQFWLDVGLDHAATTPYEILLSYPSETEPNILSLYDTNTGNDVIASPAKEENLTSEETRDDFPFPNLGYSGNGTVTVSSYSKNYMQSVNYLNPNRIALKALSHYDVYKHQRMPTYEKSSNFVGIR